ncbi:sulfatase [Sedimentisphaera cyanobacteriorum]|uniref:sulfatase n=1 Tax=Sedimentisphaera cyanobacteriorum TaxID=1940790 RepID=UPI0009875C8E|nr:sulfatase [Sedimentisphaera cyanobacteriorum]
MYLNRRNFLKSAGAASFLLAGGNLVFGNEKKRDKPNIVLFLADDLGWHQIGCYGSKFYETPNIDKLAAESMKFTDAYAAAPVCSPTRASIMTGKYPARLHLTQYIKAGSPSDEKLTVPDWTAYLPLEELTAAELLKDAGYTTGHFGKWHLNKDKDYELGRPGDPGSQGFDDVLTTHKPGAGPESPYENDAHHVRQITERAVSFIEANKDKPFFCYISHNSIHDPEIERDELIEKYRNKPGADNDVQQGHNNPVQAAMLETLDKSLADVLRKLEELDLQKDTLFVFFSDNGHLGPKDCSPLRGSKADIYEGGIREPLIVRLPGVIEPGSVCREPVISTDFFPTFAEIAGSDVSSPNVDGESIMPLLRQSGKLKRDAIFWHYPHYHHDGVGPSGAVRKGDYKLIEWFEKSIEGRHAEGAFELYNLREDLSEQNNLAEKMPEKVNELYKDLKQWRKDVGAQEMPLNPDYQQADAENPFHTACNSGQSRADRT